MTQEMEAILSDDLEAAFGDSQPCSAAAGARWLPEFRVVYYFRMASCHTRGIRGWYWKFAFRRVCVRHGITLTAGTRIGSGFRIGHLGSLVVHSKAVLGHDVTLCPGATVGKIHRGGKAGVPVIGDHVYVAANAAIIGGVTVGDHVVIAPGAFVNFNVPEHSIVIGNPGVIHRKRNPVAGMTHFLREQT